LNTARPGTAASVTVTIPARLHLGFLDLNGGLGRRFGSIGLAISRLRTRISIAPAAHMRVSGPESERVCRYVEIMHRVLGLTAAHEVRVEEAVPSHAGLGSGTQLALAVASAMRRLHGLPLDIRGDAFQLDRGARSGVGIALFDRGGLVVDGGRGAREGPAPIISHIPFPQHWRVLVVLDPLRQGVHGAHEIAAFTRLPPASAAEAAHLCRLLVMRILPSLAEMDLPTFGSAVKELQERTGDYFAPAQGGRHFASADVAAVLDVIEQAGGVGIGQSSWGPTGYAFAASPEEAERILELTRRHPAGQRARASGGVDIRICKGLNAGAEIVAHAGKAAAQ
jgi:beta-ribofuranosylaminobenzene 5'-phosphate synthase